MNQISVDCLGAFDKYNGKTVAIRIEQNGKLVVWKGVFRVHLIAGAEAVFLDVCDLSSVDWSADSGMRQRIVHLSQDHVDGICASTDVALAVSFVVWLPFYQKDHLYDE